MFQIMYIVLCYKIIAGLILTIEEIIVKTIILHKYHIIFQLYNMSTFHILFYQPCCNHLHIMRIVEWVTTWVTV